MFSIVEMMVIIFFLAFLCEVTDASFGMGYGTILAPLLLIVGYEPAVIVPAILLSQAVGGFTASVFHHRYKRKPIFLSKQIGRVILILFLILKRLPFHGHINRQSTTSNCQYFY